jgi:hypothetical protein
MAMLRQPDVRDALLFGIGTAASPLFLSLFFLCPRLHSLLDNFHVGDFVWRDLIPIAVLMAISITTDENTLYREIDNSCALRESPKGSFGRLIYGNES